LKPSLILYGCPPGGSEEIQRSAKVQAEFADASGTPKEKQMLNILIPRDWLKAHPDQSQYLPPITETISPAARARWGAS